MEHKLPDDMTGPDVTEESNGLARSPCGELHRTSVMILWGLVQAHSATRATGLSKQQDSAGSHVVRRMTSVAVRLGEETTL